MIPTPLADFLDDPKNMRTVQFVFLVIWVIAFFSTLFSGELVLSLISVVGALSALVQVHTLNRDIKFPIVKNEPDAEPEDKKD